MARQPEVFVRELDPAEAQRLVKITRTARNRIRLRRAGIVLADPPSGQDATFETTAIRCSNTHQRPPLDPKNTTNEITGRKNTAQLIPGWPYSFVAALETGRTSWTAVLDAVRLGPAERRHRGDRRPTPRGNEPADHGRALAAR